MHALVLLFEKSAVVIKLCLCRYLTIKTPARLAVMLAQTKAGRSVR